MSMRTSSTKLRRTVSQEPTPAPVAPPEVAARKTLPVIVTLSLLLVGALSAAGYFYYQYRQSPQVADAKEIDNLVETIGQFFALPEGEIPTLATVTDREKLAEQPFFQKAENGDKVLIYSQSGRAILYRPSNGKIVDVTTVNINPPTTAPIAVAPAATPPAAPEVLGETTTIETPLTIALYNGSKVIGITNKLESKITAGMSGSAVVKKEKAARDDYEQTLVVDLSGKRPEKAEALATLLGGIIGTLPAGEVPSGTDLLVIVGNSQAE